MTKNQTRPQGEVAVCTHRGCDCRYPQRRDDHRRGRRGPRERRGSDDRGGEDHAGGDQLHGEARTRADLHADDGGSARGARPAADGRPEHRPVRYRILRVDRSQGCDDDRDLRERQGGHRAGGHRSQDPSGRSRAARPHVPPQGAEGRRARTCRSDGGGRRSLQDCRPVSRRRDLRNPERRRDDGARAGADEVRAASQAPDDHDCRPHSVPDADGGAGSSRRVSVAADRSR